MGDLIKIKNKKVFSINNKSTTSAEIVIYSDIGESFWGDSMSAKSFSEELKQLPDTVNQIDVRLNSPGGDVFDGITIYNRLKQHKANVTVYIDGMAASIASIIALAGDEVIMGEGSTYMIHLPWTMAMGNALELEDTINRLDEVTEQLLGIYQRKTRLDRSEIRKMLTEETWLDAAQAMEYGFVDKIMEADETLDMAASLDNAKWIRKQPKFDNTNKYVKSEVSNLKDEIKDFLAR